MVGQTRGAPKPNMAPPRTFQPTSPPPTDAAARGAAVAPPPEPESTPDANYSASSETNIADDETKSLATTESPSVQKTQTNSNQCYSNQKLLDPKSSNVKLLNSEVPQYIKKMPQIGNSQILSIVPSGKTVENVKQTDKTENFSGGNAKRSENQPNFITMQQKLSEKLMANPIPIQRLPEQQFILKQVGSSDNIVTMTTAKIPEPNQNYFAMVTNKPQGNYVNYVSLPVNQQNFIAVDQQQKNNFVVMEAQHKTNFVTVPQKSNVQTSGQTYLVHGNGTDLKQFNSYLAVGTKPGDTNGTTFFTMTPAKQTGPQTAYLMAPKQSENSRTFVAVAQKPNEATYLALPAGKNNDNNKTATFIAMEPNKTDTNIIVTQVLPTSQPSPQLFQLEYAENDGGKGKYFNPRDSAVVQPVVPKMSCSAISSSSVMSTKPALTNTLPPLTSVSSVTPSKKSTSTTKALTSPGKTNVPPLAASGNISFISTSGNVTFLSNSTAAATTKPNEPPEPEAKPEKSNPTPPQEPAPSPSLPVPVNTVLSSNVPQAHQYLIPNVDNLKLAAENINKMMPPQVAPPNKPLKLHQTDQNFQMHNYSKNDSYPNHASKSNLQENARRKYGQHENNKLPAKNSLKYTQNMYSNHQRSDKNQNYGSFKSRIVEARPTNHQRIPETKNSEIKTYPSIKSEVKKEIKEESAEVDIDDTKVKKEEDDEEEGVEVRPVFDMRIPLVFQVVLTDHCYGMPMLLLRDEKPLHVEDDKESVISSDGKGEDGEETETANEGEDSVTRCICDLEHDDGYMVCCDKCSVWQHVACVFPDVRIGTPLPEEYLCDACHPRKLDRNRARALQMQRRKQIFNNSDSSDSSSSSLEIAPRTNKAGTGPKKAVARRRAEPVSRKPMKLNKSDASHNDGPIKSSLAKAKRRDSSIKPTASVGRRTKLKKKLETKMRPPLRRKHLPNKNKEVLKQDRDSSSQRDRSDKNESSEEPSQKSPDLRTRLQMLKSGSPKELGNKPTSRIRCRLSHLPQGEGILLSSCSLTKGQLICEIKGKYLLADEQPGKSECLFFYRFPKDGSEVVVDAAGHENLARFARRSCRPNSQLKHCLVKGSLRLYLVAKEDMAKGQEITIGHNIIKDISSPVEGCVFRSKDCPYALHKNSQNTSSTERRRRGRRRTVSEESEGSPVKNKKEPSNKVQTEPPRRNSSVTQSSRSPSSPVQTETKEKDKDKDKDRKLTREEKKIEQAMKIFAQMERDTARKKDKDRPHMPITSSGGRKDSQSGSKMDSDKESPVESNKPRRRRRRGRRKSRKGRLSSGASAGASGPYNSGDSDLSSADELPSPRRKTLSLSKDSRDDDMHSPIDKFSSPRADRTRRDSCNSTRSDKEKRNDAAGLLLALGNGRYLPGQRTPTKDKESENEGGSPPTPLSSACLLVAAAVGPLAPGFKFPKTKKGLMNEWLSKSPEHSNQHDFSPTTDLPTPNAQSESTLPPGAPKLSNLSNRLFSFPVGDKSLELKVDSAKDSRHVFEGRSASGTSAGYGKKRWLRQAISEECDAPHGQGSPPCPPDHVTPLKKRRLARESLSSDPPTTPPMPPMTSQARDERVYSSEMNSPESPNIIDTETEISLAERVDALRREYLEAQERNLLKSFERSEEESQSKPAEENENYEKFNNYDSSPQRVPENLSYDRFQESEYYQPSNQNPEKPLDLTGEKDENESEDGKSENEKIESSPKAFRKGRGKKGGAKKSDSETRSSPRVRKSGKSRKNENSLNSSEEKEVESPQLEAELEEPDSPRPHTPPLPPTDEDMHTPMSSPEKLLRRDPRLREETSTIYSDVQFKPEMFNRTENEIKEEQGFKEVFTKGELKGEWEVKTEVESFRWNQIEGNDKINQNGLECAERKEFDFKNLTKGNVPEESQTEVKSEESDQFSSAADKIAPAKRKLSITEYLKRKKSVPVSTKKSSPSSQNLDEDQNSSMHTPEASSPQGSPPSDEDRSRVSAPTPTLPPVFLDGDKSLEKTGNVRFKSEPTELERQRENLTERLRREFGLLISDDDPKGNKIEGEEATLPMGPPNLPFSSFGSEPSDYLDPVGKRPYFHHPPTQTLPQSAIYPVGSSNPPNPSCVFNSPYPPIPPPPPPIHDDMRKDKKIKKYKQ